MQEKDELHQGLIVSRYGKERGSLNNLHTVSSHKKARKLGVDYNTEHLDGLNWELLVVESVYDIAYYCSNGRIVLDTSRLYSVRSEAELASILAHEVLLQNLSGYMDDFSIDYLDLFPLTASCFLHH